MTPTTAVPHAEIAAHEGKEYHRQLDRVVRDLRELSERLDRSGRPHAQAGALGTPRYAQALQAALHDLQWGIANLNTDNLVDVAARADMHETLASVATETAP